MVQINSFEDIEAWKRGRALVREVYKMTSQDKFAKDFALRNQIRRAAISIISNIAEGFGRESDQEFSRFLYIAKGSATEVQSQLYVAMDLGYIDKNQFNELYREYEDIVKILSGFIRYLQNTK